jgi:predicted lipoprotein with Yx(FWY)xxD motif
MTRTKPLSILGLVAVPLVALAVAGCGGSSNSSSNTPAPTIPKAAGGGAATVGVSNTSLGTVLVNAQGHTIYLFKKDAGTKSTCFGACASAWPPVRVSGKPTLGPGLKASLVGTTKRSDGEPQVTYNGHPLYLFQGDHAPGDANGQGITAFGAVWYGVNSAGNQVKAQPSSGTTGRY